MKSKGRSGIGEFDFISHDAAVSACHDALSEWFHLFSEVTLSSSQLLGKALRVDLLAVAKDEPNYILGFEVKPRFYRMSEYAHAIKQAADYRLGTISESRLPQLAGRQVCGSFVFPRWHGGHDLENEYRREALGMEILSHHFRVGFADYRANAIILTMNDKRLWSGGRWSSVASGVLGGKDRIGSLKLLDPAKIGVRY